MALKKNILLNCGVTANYSKIDLQGTTILISHYLSEDARLSGKSPLLTDIINPAINIFIESELKKDGNSPLVIAYKYIKTLDEYTGAVDAL